MTRWRATIAGPAVALVTVVAAVLTTNEVGLPVRDPDHVAALYLALVGLGVALLVGLDIVLRARRLSRADFRLREPRFSASGASAGQRAGESASPPRWSAST